MSEPTIQKIKQAVRIEDIIGRFVHLKKEGAKYKAPCPFHEENTASFVVTPNKGIFKCFGCGKAGDVIDFLVHSGKSFPEAMAYLKDPNNTAGLVMGQKQPSTRPPEVEWHVIPPNRALKETDTHHYKFGKPSKTWSYHDPDGKVIGVVCRFDTPEGKQVWPMTFCTDGKREEWRWKGFKVPRPLYNLHLLKKYPDFPVVIGEGEKTADAIHDLILDHVAVTWIGGVNNVKNTDWTPLFGRDIVLWPDNDKDKKYGKEHPRKGEIMDFNDQPGNSAMLAISEILKPHCPSIQWVANPHDAPCGWDLADAEDWDAEKATFYMLDNLTPLQNILNVEIATPVEKIPDRFEATVLRIEDYKGKKKAGRKDPPNDGEKTDDDMKAGGFFKFLGYQKEGTGNTYSFYSFISRTVITLSPSGMTLPNLLQLAPYKWWTTHLEGRKQDTVDLIMAQNWLISDSAKIGIFNPRWIRGRGAWLDDKRVVIHAGDRLIVDGRETRFIDFNSKYVYEIGEAMGFDNKARPLQTPKSSLLIEIMQLMNWERDINAYLLAGWCVVAPLCGALSWRPHIWLTGSAGTGKSWIFEFIVRKLLGDSGVSVQGETSEPGLRQLLKHDALPVVFDEAEGADRKSQERMQDVLALMRSTSSNDGGIIAKGNSGGGGVTYRIRSCFAFASIAIQVSQQSDRSRVTILALKNMKDSDEKKKRWADLQRMYAENITDEFCNQLRARTISLLPVILKNAATFSAAAAAELGQQRAGDQIGALLAGAYSLRSKKLIAYDDALAFIRDKEWNEERSQETTRDETALINHLMQQITRIESDAGVQERTLGELVRIAAGIFADQSGIIGVSQADDRLKRLGMRVQNMCLVVGNSQDPIQKFLVNTAWSKNYNKILSRIEGAETVESARFATGIKVRAVKIPLNSLFLNEQGSLFEEIPVKVDNPSTPAIYNRPDLEDGDLPF